MYIPTKTISSMVTNFNSEGELELEDLKTNLEFQKKAGIESVCILGGTGEASLLAQEERHQIMEVVMENAGNLKVVIGALAGTPEEIKKDILKAKELKADAVLVMATPFIKPSERDIEKFIIELSELKMPLIIFNSPSRSGINMSESLIIKLSKMDTVVGIKESAGDINLLQNIIQNKEENFGVLVGGDKLYLPSLVLGAQGGIVAVAAAIPEVFVELDKAIIEENIEKARSLHYMIKLIDDVMFKASHPVPLKKILEIRGISETKCRAPFSDISDEHEQEIYEAIKELKERTKGVIDFTTTF